MKPVLEAAYAIAKMLPPSKIEAITARLDASVGVPNVSDLVGSHDAKQALTDFFEAARRAGLPNALAGAILMSSGHAHTATLNEQAVELVLTGPDTPFVATRRTEQVLLDLIRAAERELFLVSFVTGYWKRVLDALVEACERGVSIKVLFEASKKDGGTLDDDQSAEIVKVVPKAAIYRWTVKEAEHQGGKVHAKIALADQETAFISSANFTGHAMEKNFEAGVLIRGGDIPRDIHRHLQGLIDMNVINVVSA